MEFFSELRLYYNRKLKEALRNPAYLFMSAFLPLMYLTLFAPLLKNLTGMPGFPPDGVLNIFLPGVVVVLSVFGGSFAGFRLCDEIRQGIIERFRVTPSSRLALLLGAVFRDITNVLFQTILLSLVALPFGFHPNWTGFLLTLLILSINTALFASFSYGIALRLQSEDALAPITQGLTLPILLMAGFLLPMSLAPQWLKIAAHFDPVYYSVEAARALINGHFAESSVWQVFAVNLPLLALVFLWTLRAYRKALG
jgi:ABC-2 type transport system permease protein